MKVCSKCQQSKPATREHFHQNRARLDGLANYCRTCFSAVDRQRYLANADKKLAASRVWYGRNKERRARTGREWSKRNPDRRRAIGRNAQRRRRASDPVFRVSQSVSAGIRRMLRTGKGGRSWQEIVGYSIEDLRRHLEAQFSPHMSWANYGAVWEIDHRRPIASFRVAGVEDIAPVVRACWALPNLRPLDCGANKRKGARLVG